MKKLCLNVVFWLCSTIMIGQIFGDDCREMTGLWVEIIDRQQSWKSEENLTHGFIRIQEYKGKYKMWIVEGSNVFLYEFLQSKSTRDGCIFKNPAKGTFLRANTKQLYFYRDKIAPFYRLDMYPKPDTTAGFYKIEEWFPGIPKNLYNMEKEIPGTNW